MEKRNNPSGKTDPIDKKEEVQKSKDKHIDQDYENYPHHPAKENIVHPKTKDDLKIAGSGDVEEFAHVKPEKKDSSNEMIHTGSGGAFEATEEVDHDSDKKRMEEKLKRKNKIY